MTHDKKTPSGSLESVLNMLQTLRCAPGGEAFLAQIERAQEVRAGLQALVEQAFVSFLRNAVDRYARTVATTDRITRLKIKQIEQRLAVLGKSETLPPELPDAAALLQHLVAVLWTSGQSLAPKQNVPAAGAAAASERLTPLQQTLETRLNHAILSNFDSIAALGSIELTLKGVQPGELEEWREILHDAAREIIDNYRQMGENLRQAQTCAREIGRQLATPSPLNGSAMEAEREELLRRLEAEMRRAQRYHFPLSLALLGPDHLEDIKMLVGPQAAGEILRRYQESIAGCARAYDTVTGCRPHKLAWLLPGAEPTQGVKALYKAQERLSSTHYHYGGRLRPLPSFSAGIVGFIPGENSARFLARALVLASRAKLAGPRRIECDQRRAAATAKG